MTKIFAHNTGRSHHRMNPTYTRTRNVRVNEVFHVYYGVPVGNSKRFDYLVDRNKDILRQLIGKMYRNSDLHITSRDSRGFYRETNRLSKETILDTLLAGTSLGEYIDECQLAAGTSRQSPFHLRHTAKRSENFPVLVGINEGTEGTEAIEYYPPIFDMQNRGSCLGYEIVLFGDSFIDNANRTWGPNYQIAVAFWFALLGEYKDLSIDNKFDLNEIQGIYAEQTMTIGGHIAQIGTCIKQGMDNNGSTANNMLKMVDLGFCANTPLQSCLNK